MSPQFPSVADELGEAELIEPKQIFSFHKRLKDLLEEDMDVNVAKELLREEPAVARDRFDGMHQAYKGFKMNRGQLISANQRLVMAVAKRFRKMGLPLEELFSYGNHGLIRAVDKFEPQRGNKFSTYAIFWIRQAIQRGFREHGRLIRLSEGAIDFLYAMRREERQFSHEHGRKPTAEELAGIMDVPTLKIHEMRKANTQPMRIDIPRGTNGEGDFSSALEGASDSVSLRPEQEELRAVMDAAFERIRKRKIVSERDIQVFRLHKGLDGRDTLEVADIAPMIGTTNARVRQILSRMERILKGELRSFMERSRKH